ncbi:undecaprenyl-diphosphate phosphatase [Leuconostoc holzapfelii]|uniref:Undecaprenyl-diphosphatase n=1 Tax=Leuconostoc holzapfelii TaxID=434464 RepID=A0A846ZC12_9LACO|nr:undecaprenyl-diphosphate phosphatase [Leuconostoc holzapfelii]MCT8389110.1 undecaprenyl-diphosphate phosphatase [Leuconostoc holzapfelii]NKZ18996.1 undecaprenyl-diphosphate phosphatase [Leuconostoc holzapfelii]
MLDFIKSIIIGIVEGITEFLPVSSTGHIILAESLMNIPGGAVWTKSFTAVFDYAIQLGAIFAVIQLYFHKLNPFSTRKTPRERFQTWRLWIKVIVGVLPAVVFGLLLNDFMDAHLLNPWVVSATLIIYGIAFIVIENRQKGIAPRVTDVNKITFQMALFIGLFQLLSLVPGTSRSGATILGAILLGASRFVAAEFSFFLSIPVMFGVTILKVGMFLLHGGSFTGAQLVVLFIGFIVSWIVAWFAIKFMMQYIQNNDFKAFGWYRIVVGVLFLILGVTGLVHMS